MQNDKLKTYRKKIDILDSIIAKTILRRNAVIKEIGKFKSSNGIKIKDNKREKEILKNVKKYAKTNEDKKFLIEIYNKLLIHSKKEQERCSKRSK